MVFACRATDSTDYIKRVIGLPRDKIQVREGLLYINGEPVKRERLADSRDDENRRSLCEALARDVAQRGQL